MVVKALPEVTKEVAAPLASISDVHVYGTSGAEAAGLSGNVPVVLKQAMEVIHNATGVDLQKIMEDNSQVIAGSADIKTGKK